SMQAVWRGLLGGADMWRQLAVRVCVGLVDSRDVDRILGPGRWAGGWCADRLRLPGSFLIHVPGVHETPCPARAFWLSEEEVARTAARFSTDRPTLDPASAAAAGRLPASSRMAEAKSRGVRQASHLEACAHDPRRRHTALQFADCPGGSRAIACKEWP